MKDNNIPHLLFPGKNAKMRQWIAKLKRKKLIHKIGPRLFTSLNSNEEIKKIVRANWTLIVSNLFPNSLLAYKTAFEYRPGSNDEIILVGSTNREIKYPGLTLKFVRGPLPLEDDPEFLKLRASSFPRALLENLGVARDKSLRIDQKVLERKLEKILLEKGEKEILQIKDRAKQNSIKFKMKKSFKHLEEILGALLGTRSAIKLKSNLAFARAMGEPYDDLCVERLSILYGQLMHYPFQIIQEKKGHDHFINKAFFEAYFSNFIEGTEFTIEEAEEIIFRKKSPKNRPKDAHDVSGTFDLVSDPNEMRKVPENFDRLFDLLISRHKHLLMARSEANPGKFKTKPNRAGNTFFVDPKLVLGTLKKGWDFYHGLPKGMARATFILFLITDVHPFTDGNGRIARIMMNAELYSQGLGTIIVPTVFGDDYLSALRAMSRRNRALPLIKTMTIAQKYSYQDFSNYPKILSYMHEHHWFIDPAEGKLVFP